MILIDRWIEISDYLKVKKFATVDELMDKFNISRSTLRRNLIDMEAKGIIKRVRGGAEFVDNNTNSSQNTIANVFLVNKEEKLQIAKEASTIIRDGDIIFIDSGSTCYYMIDYINASNVTVVTNGIYHIQRLMERGINTYILGGYAKPEQNLIVGEDVIQKVKHMNFNTAFLGTMGVDEKVGFTSEMLVDGEVKRAVIQSSERCYVLADSTKFNKRKFYTYGSPDIGTVITTTKTDFTGNNFKITRV